LLRENGVKHFCIENRRFDIGNATRTTKKGGFRRQHVPLSDKNIGLNVAVVAHPDLQFDGSGIRYASKNRQESVSIDPKIDCPWAFFDLLQDKGSEE
jgi:hypothetical protein